KSSKSRNRASSLLNRAEQSFRGMGVRGLHGLHRAFLIRTDLQLGTQQGQEAFEGVTRYVRLRKARRLSVPAGAILVKSRLLTEVDVPEVDGVYEGVLRELGLVRDPLVLFQVIANLYLYTWKLNANSLDLTDLHLRQLTRLRDSLDEDVYRRLYHEYVTVPVMERWMRHMGGEPPRRPRRF
ncbi:MAG: hypothetical protein O7J95_19770, partial [Planctomycetota bacterium]|nr:hypothetical protein [Planctomycetota bacterium]